MQRPRRVVIAVTGAAALLTNIAAAQGRSTDGPVNTALPTVSGGERPGPGERGVYCQVKQQLKRRPPSAYGWGRERCSQKLVGTAR